MAISPYLNNISFNSINKRPRLNKHALAHWINSVAENAGYKIEGISFNFCSDEYLLEMNNEYLQHNYYTDIITFDLSNKQKTIEGDVYISIDRVKENAVTSDVTFENELSRVLIHGLLHLMGYKDKTTRDQKKMREMENSCLKLLIK